MRCSPQTDAAKPPNSAHHADYTHALLTRDHTLNGAILFGLDRIDLQVELERLSTDERFAETKDDESPKLRARIEAARQRQTDRFAGRGVPFNAAIPGGQVRDLCNFSPAGFARFKATIDQNALSTRSMDRLAKVARTVADLNGTDQVQPVHLDTAATFVIGGMLREGA